MQMNVTQWRKVLRYPLRSKDSAYQIAVCQPAQIFGCWILSPIDIFGIMKYDSAMPNLDVLILRCQMDAKGSAEYDHEFEKYDSSVNFEEKFSSRYQLGRLAAKYPDLTPSDALDHYHHLENRLTQGKENHVNKWKPDFP